MIFKHFSSRIHEALGLENATLMPESTCSSAAPLNVDTFLYFQSLDIVIYELLGCTESVAQTTNMAGNKNIFSGTVHKLLEILLCIILVCIF